jgi:hypothetical protein
VSGPHRATSIINVILKLADISWNPIKIRGKQDFIELILF